MKKFHESGLFFYIFPNGLLTNRMPADVRNYKVHFKSGNVIDNFYNKVFYFRDMSILEVILQDGERRFFQYRARKKSFVEIDERDISLDY